jgi:hypothetical protein
MSSPPDAAAVVEELPRDPAERAGWCVFWFVLAGFAALHWWAFGYWMAIAIPFTLFPTLAISAFCGLATTAIVDGTQPQRIPPLPA